MQRLLAALALLACGGVVRPADADADLLKALVDAGPGARASWDKVVARGPAILPAILVAMDHPDSVRANWLRTAFDRIVDAEMKAGGKRIPVDALLAFARNAKRQGRARRLALETVEPLRPGITASLTAGWLDDPEFRYEAIEALIKQADEKAKAGQQDQALADYQRAFTACREVPQAQELALRLKELGKPVSIAEHFGFFTDWYVIGPFDAKGKKGFKTVYPPEEKVDLDADYAGKKWQRYQVTESLTAPPARAVLANLVTPLGQAEDAVAYAFTVFTMTKPLEVEFRGSADDNLSVWVNGRREFGFEEYRNGVRLDRHRFKVKLRPGANTVLVKVCQAPTDPTNTEPNWEFLLRMVDAEGRGLPVRSALPAP